MKNLKTLLLLIAFFPLMLNGMEIREDRAGYEELGLAEDLALQQAIEASLTSLYQAEQTQTPQILTQEKEKEDQAETIELSELEKLPLIAHERIALQLGNNPVDTIKNIITLSRVNTYFHALLQNKPNTVKRLLIERYGETAIAQALLSIIMTTGDLDLLKRFVDLFVILEEDIPLIDTVNPKWIKHLAYHMSKNKEYISFCKTLITHLIDTKVIDINKEYHGKTLLHWMIEFNNKRLSRFIIKSYHPEQKVPNTKAGQKFRKWNKKTKRHERTEKIMSLVRDKQGSKKASSGRRAKREKFLRSLLKK
jgi:hypothetical protein